MTDPTQAVVWLDGAIREPGLAAVPWSDHGVTVGDGIFETLLLVDGRPFALRRHLRRLARSADGLGIELPDGSTLRRAVSETCDAWGTAPGRLRITVTSGPGPMGSERGDAGPTLLVAATSVPAPAAATTVALVPWTRNERGALAGLKTTSYGENVVALAAARQHGATEAVLANTAGELCEGTGSNILVVHGDDLVTPPLDSGCLAGITRELLLEALARAGTPAVERSLPFDVLLRCPAAALTSSTRNVQPIETVVDLDGGRRNLATDHPLLVTALRAWDDAHGPGTDPDP